MAETTAPANSNSFMSTISQKVAGLPIGVWVGLIAVVGGYLWYRHNQNAAATTAATATTGTDLGTAANAANQFTTAGLMPYSGGDTYINSVGTGTIGSNPAPTAPTTQTVNIQSGQDIGQFINNVRAKMNPNFTWADFWALNPKIASSLKQDPKTKVWKSTKPITVTISTPALADVPGGIQKT